MQNATRGIKFRSGSTFCFKPGNKIQNGDHGRRFTFGERFVGQVTAVYQKFQRFVNNYCSFMLN